MQMGVTVELLSYFAKTCPKYGESRLLPQKNVEGEIYYDTDELLRYRRYLSQPWPKKPDSQRPYIPDAIKNDVRAECHLACAICGDLNKGEIAHIEAVATTANNSPDNLILLCPNHHTEYDLGFKPSSNVNIEALKAAKVLKRDARVRMQRYEANAYKAARSVLTTVKKLETMLQSLDSRDMAEVYETELNALMRDLPQMLDASQEQAKKDQDLDGMGALITKAAPRIAKATAGLQPKAASTQVRKTATSVIETIEECLVELDEINCPHCGGTGTTGLVGDYCSYCKGDMVVSEAEADAYDPDELDERDCPHCGGRGLTGLTGFFCVYCKGSCRVSERMVELYDCDEIDEVDCPHCHGRGATGFAGDICTYCDGAQTVSAASAAEYDRSQIDEVDCPHCLGSGLTGLVQEYCAYCKGSQTISSAKANVYDREEIDEVDCPHCFGSGLTGLVQEYCAYCKGSQTVSRAKAAEYDRDEIDEVECPRCGGAGTIGLRGTICTLCNGACTVSKEKRTAFKRRQRERE
jgi:RecJ-like exonuclease